MIDTRINRRHNNYIFFVKIQIEILKMNEK